MKKSATFIILIIALVFILPGPSLAQSSIEFECAELYIVQANDWLSKIAEKYFDDMMAYPAIVEVANADANDAYTDIVNPDLIEPGWVLCIPSNEATSRLLETVPPGLTLPELANATYTSDFTQSGIASLTHGEYREPGSPGSATETKIVMLVERTDYGQLNGERGAVVILVTNPGGSGTFYNLHIMISQNGQPTEFSRTLLGDRVQINGISLANNQIMVDMIQAGPYDPICCPSEHVIKTFTLQKEKLVQASSRVVGENSPAIVGLTWKWLGFTDPTGQSNIVVPNPDVYRLELLPDGTFRARADCKTVSGTYALGDNNLTLRLVSTTKAKCQAGSLYNQYLALLRRVVAYAPDRDKLVLNLAANGGSMNFNKLHAVTGTIIGPVGATLPAGAMLEVKVMDVTAGPPGVQMGGVLKDIGALPVDFEAVYNPQAVAPDNAYTLEVTIKDQQGNLLYQNHESYPVLTRGNPTYKIVVMIERETR